MLKKAGLEKETKTLVSRNGEVWYWDEKTDSYWKLGEDIQKRAQGKQEKRRRSSESTTTHHGKTQPRESGGRWTQTNQTRTDMSYDPSQSVKHLTTWSRLLLPLAKIGVEKTTVEVIPGKPRDIPQFTNSGGDDGETTTNRD